VLLLYELKERVPELLGASRSSSCSKLGRNESRLRIGWALRPIQRWAQFFSRRGSEGMVRAFCRGQGSNGGESIQAILGVKDFYLDSTPTHSYMKYLYKYPQAAYPYGKLIETNRGRSRQEFEYELLDTGVFDQDRYFDVFVEYAKESPDDILIQISVHNRGPEPAQLHVLPTLWFRNQWSWQGASERPTLQRLGNAIQAVDPKLGARYMSCEGDVPLLFTENETNTQRIFGVPNRSP